MPSDAYHGYRYDITNMRNTNNHNWVYTLTFYKLPDQTNPVHEVDLTHLATMEGIAYSQAKNQAENWIDTHG